VGWHQRSVSKVCHSLVTTPSLSVAGLAAEKPMMSTADRIQQDQVLCPIASDSREAREPTEQYGNDSIREMK